jgi:hypothetical protein
MRAGNRSISILRRAQDATGAVGARGLARDSGLTPLSKIIVAVSLI